MSGFLGAVEGLVGDVAGGMGGGDFLSELMSVLEGGEAQGGSSGTMGEIGQIASDVLPIAAMFL